MKRICNLGTQLLKELAEHGWLIQEAGGKRYSPINALYNVRMERKNGDAVVKKFMIAVKRERPGANLAPESSFPLVPERSAFGEQRALRDTQPDAQAEEPLIEDVTPT